MDASPQDLRSTLGTPDEPGAEGFALGAAQPPPTAQGIPGQLCRELFGQIIYRRVWVLRVDLGVIDPARLRVIGLNLFRSLDENTERPTTAIEHNVGRDMTAAVCSGIGIGNLPRVRPR